MKKMRAISRRSPRGNDASLSSSIKSNRDAIIPVILNRDELVDNISDSARSTLDGLVESGDMTPDERDRAIADMQSKAVSRVKVRTTADPDEIPDRTEAVNMARVRLGKPTEEVEEQWHRR